MADEQGKEERKENSVLFSLSNLAAVGSADAQQEKAGQAASGAQGDKSGLIDLNTLAQLGANTPGESAAPSGGMGEGAVGVPALFNVGTRRSNKGLMIGVAFLLLVVVGLGVFLTYLLVFKEEEKAAESANTAEEEPPPEEDLGVEGGAQANKAEAVEGEGAEAEGEGEDGEDGEGDGEDGEGEDGEGEDGADGDGEGEGDAAAVGDPEDDKKKKKRRKKDGAGSSTDKTDKTDKEAKDDKKDDKEEGVDDALSRIRSGGSKAKVLEAAELKKFLMSNSLKAKKCGKGGDLIVQFDLKESGKFTNVKTVKGSFKGTDVEACILKTVKKWKFRKFSGGAKNGVKFPFKL